MILKKTCFISYSRRDKYRIAQYLAIWKAVDVPLFIDFNDIVPGENWRNAVDKALGDVERVLLFWPKNSAKSKEARREISIAKKMNKTIVPLILDNTPLWSEIKYINGIDLRISWSQITAFLLSKINTSGMKNNWWLFIIRLKKKINTFLYPDRRSLHELIEEILADLKKTHKLIAKDLKILIVDDYSKIEIV